MKNTGLSVKEKLIAKYLVKNQISNPAKSTDINVLLNRVKLDRKKETRKKFYFSAVASTGLVLFGLIVFS